MTSHKSDNQLSNRKTDHLLLAQKSQTLALTNDDRFYYEPLFKGHPEYSNVDLSTTFLGKKVNAPIWVSSMTGGSGEAGPINKVLAKVCREFGLGFALGSCRSLLEGDEYFEDFNLRSILGDELPFLANIGIAQLDELLEKNESDKLNQMVERLKADGLIIHVNPLQEFFQPEGDRFKRSPLEIINDFLAKTTHKIMVKEVGQGMGPRSLKALLEMPISAIEFGAYGGTNFSFLEMQRSLSNGNDDISHPHAGLANVGHTSDEMVIMLNRIISEIGGDGRDLPEIIISGGIKNYLDGFYLTQKCQLPCLYGQAKGFLEYAFLGEQALRDYVESQIMGLKMAHSFLSIKGD
ncbi:MAG: type 2 isopentenyl-diphosphate Delta-isomerase [Oligoflexia bacterium]|nr:type 2 isopentenyl-diphosphate Delta-isomerase [Oligoflexia bacterium]